jgi:hypothetical protein
VIYINTVEDAVSYNSCDEDHRVDKEEQTLIDHYKRLDELMLKKNKLLMHDTSSVIGEVTVLDIKERSDIRAPSMIQVHSQVYPKWDHNQQGVNIFS